jgi:hypothetical protein
MAPDAIPIVNPIMAPILTRSKQDTCCTDGVRCTGIASVNEQYACLIAHAQSEDPEKLKRHSVCADFVVSPCRSDDGHTEHR